MRYFPLLISLFMSMTSTGFSFAEEFPYRDDYPEVMTVDLADLKKWYDDGSVVIIDVRSPIEYETIKIKGALHVNLSNADFLDNIKAVAAQNPLKKLAVYCNGITCLKSYRAAQEAVDAGIANVYAYDAGIPAWTRAYPSETLLLDRVVFDPDKQIIPASEFKARAFDFETFKQKIGEATNPLVIDARDPIQRTKKLPGFEDAMPIPLDKLIRNVVKKGYYKDKQLFIFDQVGKQVGWLMYYLVDQGYEDYYFLMGGATAVLKTQQYR